jgi:SAM-dependent methyltransferase
MEKVRKYHNNIKRELINEIGRDLALDVGCGHGGDIKKWSFTNATLHACDPDTEALAEAKRRSESIEYPVNFYHGDITNTPMVEFDVICYNFSIQYIFQNEKLFYNSIDGIVKRLKPGGTLFGCVPDSEMILVSTPYRDYLGNVFNRCDHRTGWGRFGEMVSVKLADTPYYKNGYVPEPIAYKDILISILESHGIHLRVWKPIGNRGISSLYSKFIFVRDK